MGGPSRTQALDPADAGGRLGRRSRVRAGTLVTFAQLAGSRRGEQGLLFDPETQSPKVIAVWKQLEPLPRVIETPLVIIGGMSPSGLSTRCCTARWRRPGRGGIYPRAWRLAGVFSEFMGPFNLLHQPLPLSVIAWGFWAVAALLEAVVIVAVLERGARAASPGSTRATAATLVVTRARPAAPPSRRPSLPVTPDTACPPTSFES
jgi:hypothetical protein